MRLLFFSADLTEVEQARIELMAAGIECEVRQSPSADGLEPDPASLELWIRRDRDAHPAIMKCVELGIGFSRRVIKVVSVEELEEERDPARAA